jgi:hypothetical protein
MVKIYLSINNNEEVILLPVTPEEYEISEPWNNQEVEGLNQVMNIIQTKGLSSLSIESFFPSKDYPFLLSRDMWGMEYVETIKRWRERRVPLRLIITNDGKAEINMAVTIDNFTYSKDKSGDIKYKLDLKEFKFVEVV